MSVRQLPRYRSGISKLRPPAHRSPPALIHETTCRLHPVVAALPPPRGTGRHPLACGWMRPTAPRWPPDGRRRTARRLICRAGRPVTYWLAWGRPAEDEHRHARRPDHSPSPACRPAAGPARARAQARGLPLQHPGAARRAWPGLPVDTFHRLLDRSIGFNRFVMNQLNERLGQFIAAPRLTE